MMEKARRNFPRGRFSRKRQPLTRSQRRRRWAKFLSKHEGGLRDQRRANRKLMRTLVVALLVIVAIYAATW